MKSKYAPSKNDKIGILNARAAAAGITVRREKQSATGYTRAGDGTINQSRAPVEHDTFVLVLPDGTEDICNSVDEAIDQVAYFERRSK